MIILGIDPGSRRCGWGAVESDGNRLTLRGAGVSQIPEATELPERLVAIEAELLKAIESHPPDVVYFETVFHHKNAQSAFVLAQARGAAILAVARAGLSVREVSPAEVKKAVTGNGRAEKDQVGAMVRVLLGTTEKFASDAADALAVAITGSAAIRWAQKLEAESARHARRRGR